MARLVVFVHVVSVLVACGGAPGAPLSHRGESPVAATPPMLGDRGLRGHEDGRAPTKASIEALLPGTIAHVHPDVIVVELAGTPAPKLLDKGIDGDVAMLVFRGGAEVQVFTPKLTMSHGLTVGMTLDDARRRQPKLDCQIHDPRIGDAPSLTPPPYVFKVCVLPGAPHFGFHMHDDRIDYISFVLGQGLH